MFRTLSSSGTWSKGDARLQIGIVLAVVTACLAIGYLFSSAMVQELPPTKLAAALPGVGAVAEPKHRARLEDGSTAQSSSSLPAVLSVPPGGYKEGTQANAKLVEDATKALFTHLQIPEAKWTTVKVARFVIQQPVGPTGKTAWREMWMVMVEEPAARQFIVTFQEDGAGSAHFRIEG